MLHVYTQSTWLPLEHIRFRTHVLRSVSRLSKHFPDRSEGQRLLGFIVMYKNEVLCWLPPQATYSYLLPCCVSRRKGIAPPPPIYKPLRGAPAPYVPAKRPKFHGIQNIDDIAETFGKGYSTHATEISVHKFDKDTASDASKKHHHHLKNFKPPKQ